MSESVETPNGVKTVLKPEELQKQTERTASAADRKYVKQPDGTYSCAKCGATIMAARVAHPVWDGPFPMSGGGSCTYEDVPYCPTCESRPGFAGSPVAPKGSYHNP